MKEGEVEKRLAILATAVQLLAARGDIQSARIDVLEAHLAALRGQAIDLSSRHPTVN